LRVRTNRSQGKGEKKMPKITKEKVGNVTLVSLGPGRWECRWYDPRIKNTIRRRFKAGGYREAKETARKLDRDRLQERGFLPSNRARRGGYTVQRAITAAIRSTRANDTTRRAYSSAGAFFVDWIQRSYPNIETWEEIKPFQLEEYVKNWEQSGLAYDTIRRRFFVIRKTSAFMSDNFGLADIARKVKITRREKPKAIECLSREDAKALLSFARDKHPALYPVLQLQSLCGLRIMESVNLRECDIDLRAGTVTVDKTEFHTPKTRYSYRTIPIPRGVLNSLIRVMNKNKIRGRESFIFQPGGKRSNPGGPWTLNGISPALKRVFQSAYQGTGNKAFEGFMPRKLRATFTSIATQAGAGEMYLMRYLGHAPLSVMGRHYQRITIQDFQREIVSRIERAFSDREEEIFNQGKGQ